MPSNKDIVVGAIGEMTTSGAILANAQASAASMISKRPAHLLTVEIEPEEGKTKPIICRFISLDKPDFPTPFFVSFKGFQVDLSKEEIIKNYAQIIANTPKEQIVEMMFPATRVLNSRSLVFNANKNLNK